MTSPPTRVDDAARGAARLWTRARRRLGAVILLVLATGVTQSVVVGSAQAVPGEALLARLPTMAGLDLSPDRFGYISPLRPEFVAAQAAIPPAPRVRRPSRPRTTPKVTAPVVPVTTNVTTPVAPTTTSTVPTTVKPRPRLVVTMQADESAVRRGDTFEYTIEVHNTGDASYSGTATIRSHVPYGTIQDSGCSGSSGSSCDTSPVVGSPDRNAHQVTATFTFSTRHALRPGDVASYHFAVRVRNTVKSGTVLTNHAHLSQDGAPDQTTDPVEVTVE